MSQRWVLIAAHETNGIFEYIDSMGVIVGSYPIRLNLILIPYTGYKIP